MSRSQKEMREKLARRQTSRDQIAPAIPFVISWLLDRRNQVLVEAARQRKRATVEKDAQLKEDALTDAEFQEIGAQWMNVLACELAALNREKVALLLKDSQQHAFE